MKVIQHHSGVKSSRAMLMMNAVQCLLTQEVLFFQVLNSNDFFFPLMEKSGRMLSRDQHVDRLIG